MVQQIDGGSAAITDRQDAVDAEVAPEQFRAAMARFPSGVVVVTTRCADGTPGDSRPAPSARCRWSRR